MKQKTIKTDKATLLVCELPQGAKNIRVDTNQSVIPYGQEVNYEVPATKESYGYEETEGFALPEGNWQLLGRLPDITEEQLDKVITKIDDNDETYGFERFMSEKDFDRSDFVEACKNRLESLNSLLQANEVHFENSLGEEPNRNDDYYRDAMGVEYHYHDDLKKWQEAQSKIWDKERCFLFLKIE